MKHENIKNFIAEHEYLDSLKHAGELIKKVHECIYDSYIDCELCKAKKSNLLRDNTLSESILDSINGYKNVIAEGIETKERAVQAIKESHVTYQAPLLYIKKYGSQIAKDICKTIETKSNNRYFKVTEKMRNILASEFCNFTLEEFASIFRNKIIY